MKTEFNIPFEELHLNIKHQNIRVEEFMQVGYEFEEGKFVFVLIIPDIRSKNEHI